MSVKRLSKEALGPRLEPDARRAHLLAVGAAAFGAKAYDEVQIDQIAQLAGVSRGLLYHYFPSKRHFFSAIVQSGYDEILQATQPDPALPPSQQLQASLTAYLDHVESHPHTYRALFRSAASPDQAIQEMVNRNLDLQAKRILDALGATPSTKALKQLAIRSWLAFLVQAVLDWLDDGSRIPRQQLLDVCVAALGGALAATERSRSTSEAQGRRGKSTRRVRS